MPEGPEVECTRIGLQKIEGKKISNIVLTELSQKYSKYRGKQKDFEVFHNKRIKEIRRKGKFLIWIFDFDQIILNHLGMSGKWVHLKKSESLPKHSKVIIKIEDSIVVFDDVRNFGQFRIFESLEKVLTYNPIKKMGIDGLQKPFPIDEFVQKLNDKNYRDRKIGSVLLDQKLIAGIGNIYRSEALFSAKVSPKRKVKNLSKEEKERLGFAISKTLNRALECNGSTFSVQPFITPNGKEGSAQDWHNVYSRDNIECKICSEKIVRLKWEGRSIFFCPKCQK